MEGLPAGFRFSPTDEELIVECLEKKVKGDRLAKDDVFECNIYDGKEPWMLFDKTVKKIYYVFTRLKKKSKSRMERKVGCGTWKGEDSDVVLNDKNRPIGFKKLFTFVEDEGSRSSTNGHWIMHEFSIGELDEYVLCRIRNKDLDKIKTYNYEPQLYAAWERILATRAMNQSHISQRIDTRNLVPDEANRQQKKMKLAQEYNDTSMEISSAAKQSQYDEIGCHYVHTHFEPMQDGIQGFGTRNVREGNQQGGMIQCSNIVVAEQSNLWSLENLEAIFSSEPPQTEYGFVDIANSNMEVSSLNHETHSTSSTDPSALNVAETKVTTQGGMSVISPQVFISSGSNAYTTPGEGSELVKIQGQLDILPPELIWDDQLPSQMDENFWSNPYF